MWRSGEKTDSCEGIRGLRGLRGLWRERGGLRACLRVKRFGDEKPLLAVGEAGELDSRLSFPFPGLSRRGGTGFRKTMKTSWTEAAK